VFPFDLLDYEEPGPLDRALGLTPPRNAYVELHNLIAAAASPADFGPDDLDRIGRRHGVNLREAFHAERQALYERYLLHVLRDGRFDERERATLAHLARTLALDAADLRHAHERAFGHTVTDALADDCLSVEERLLLYTLQHTLGLDPTEAEQVYEWEARQRLLETVARALCDGELDPAEAEEITALETELDVRVPTRVDALLTRAAHRWRLTHGPPPNVDVGIRLLPGEIGHFRADGRWRTVNYALLRVALRDHRERLHAGDTAGLHVPEYAFVGRGWQRGVFVVTSKRLLLVRDQGDPVIHSFRAILGIERYANGVRVSIKGDRSVLLDAWQDNRALHSVLWQALHPGRARPEAG